MKLVKQDWFNIASFLFVEKKMKDSDQNVNCLKSRYLALTREFYKTEFTKDNLNRFLYRKKLEGSEPSTLNNLIKMSKLLGEYFKTDEFKNIKYYHEVRKPKETLSPNEIKQLAEINIDYRQEESDFLNKRQKAIIYFLGLNGCRVTEARNLKWEDVKSINNYYTVTFRDTKNGENRTIPIPNMVYDLLCDQKRSDEYVFVSHRGNIVGTEQLNLDLKRRAKQCSINKLVTNHTFRWSYITTQIRQKVPIPHIARIVGHKNLESTNYYASLIMDDLFEAQLNHPLLREVIQIHTIKERTEEFYKRIIDPDRFKFSLSYESKKLHIDIEQLPSVV